MKSLNTDRKAPVMQSIKQILHKGKNAGGIGNNTVNTAGSNITGEVDSVYCGFSNELGINNGIGSNGINYNGGFLTDENKPEEMLPENGFEHDVLSDKFLKTLVNISTDIITLIDTSGTILYESNSIESMLGYYPGELIGKNAFTFIHRDDLKKVQG